MEMNVCHANTNWLRGEQDCTKDPKKKTKKKGKKNNKTLKVRLYTHCTYLFSAQWGVVSLILFGNKLKSNASRSLFSHFPFIFHLCSVWPHHPPPRGDGPCVSVCVYTYTSVCVSACVCVFERMIRSWGLVTECLYKRTEGGGAHVCLCVYVRVCACAPLCMCLGHPRQWEGPGDGLASSASSWWLMLAGLTRPGRPAKLKAYFVKL